MATFRFRLQTILRLRENERDERRRELAQALQAKEVLEEYERRTAEEWEGLNIRLRDCSRAGEVQVDLMLNLRRYQMTVAAQREALKQQMAQVEEEIERRRERLAEADRQVRVLELLRERQFEQYRREEDRLETKMLDEVGSRGAVSEVDP
ncbi:MAG: flagellar export protein FliJ [Thermogutta sp.]|nr:flagellar export protein FliJ [Thermogutta sp.]